MLDLPQRRVPLWGDYFPKSIFNSINSHKIYWYMSLEYTPTQSLPSFNLTTWNPALFCIFIFLSYMPKVYFLILFPTFPDPVRTRPGYNKTKTFQNEVMIFTTLCNPCSQMMLIVLLSYSLSLTVCLRVLHHSRIRGWYNLVAVSRSFVKVAPVSHPVKKILESWIRKWRLGTRPWNITSVQVRLPIEI